MSTAGTTPPCCLLGFAWDGQPTGQTALLATNQTYVTGTNGEVAILLIHDLLGWTFGNTRLVADHLAAEANATVYVPDFFGGEALPAALILTGRWAELDVPGFVGRNSRDIREPEILACARALRQRHRHVGAIGYCYGGWAAMRLAADPALVDCVAVAHPSLLTEADIDGVRVPVQVLAPERDHVFTPELKMHCFRTIPAAGLAFDYQHFPGVEHACLIRGDPALQGEREAMVRGKNAAVAWFRQFLYQS